ncbi:MAG: hypothetical protein RIS44_3175 [Pseudomonadota bacterium]|jgi:lipopolysaccharide transport system permease protein
MLWSDLALLWRSKPLLWTLTRRELQARNAGSAIGVIWLFAQPLLMIAAYFLVFDVVFSMRLGDKAPTQRVGAYLVVGSVPWMAFCDAVQRGTNSLIDSGVLLQKNPLPPVLFPARAVLASAVIYGPLIVLLAIFYTPYHHGGLGILALMPLVLLQAVLCFVLAYALAIVAAAIRDTTQVMTFLLSVGIFASPVLFPVHLFPQDWQWVLWINPMTPFVMGYQAVLLQGQLPPLAVWLSIAIWISVGALILHYLVKRSRDELVDWL